MSGILLELSYLGAAVLFIVSLKWMATPQKAGTGNRLSALGMLIAVVATLFDRQILGYGTIMAGMAIGAAIGVWMGRAVKMTAMPQLVAILNGFGGGAAQLVAAAEWHRLVQPGAMLSLDTSVTIYAGALIGAMTFSGSIVAAAKLQEIIQGRPILFRGQQFLNLLLLLTLLGLFGYLLHAPDSPRAFILLNVLALVLGLLLVIPIGGADMPVVICLHDSYSGLAAAATGFVIGNHGLIITGALVGASGIILTRIMCRTMNRSLISILLGGFGARRPGETAGEAGTHAVQAISVEDAAVALSYANTVTFVPGYGLAVAQAQHELQELASLLEEKGISVKFGIHPVAGRMPGHMNVLLADAEVPYEKLYDMDAINPQFEHTDLVMIVGANDVVNPAARTDPGSPLYGMPILDADRARHIIILKRSLSPGFAGVDNELFYDPKTSILFGHAKKMLADLITETKQLNAQA